MPIIEEAQIPETENTEMTEEQFAELEALVDDQLETLKIRLMSAIAGIAE